LPIAIYALHLVERSKISMRQMVDLAPYDACLGTGMLGRYYLNYPGLSISVANLLEPMMLISDNSASDAILKIIGGPRKLYQYLKQNGFDDIHVDRSFMEIYEVTTGLDILPPKSTYTLKKWQKWKETGDHNVKNRQYREFYEDEKDTTTPRAMNHLVLNLYNNVLLNKTNTDFLIDIMKRTWDGHRINRFLPPNVKIAHKTGTWYDNDVPEAHYGYLNDVGIIYLPDNKGHIAISIYSSSDKIKDIKSYAIALGKVSKLVYDELSS
jgi:beta-lactamase class A